MPRKPEPSFGLKQIIWDIAASTGAENLSAIHRQVEGKLRELHKDKKLYGEETPEIRTLKRIIELDINRLLPEVVVSKLAPYVWHLRNDYKDIKQLAEEKQQKPPTEALTEQEPYDETPHKQKMRELAGALAEGIHLPSPWNKDLWRDLPVEFKPGKYSLPIGLVEIDEDKQIKVEYYDVGAGIAEPHLVKGLYSHLSTSGLPRFVELVGDKGKLNNFVSEAGQYSQALLMFLKQIVDEVRCYRARVSFYDEVKPGLTKWFVITAWNDAIQKAGGYSWIDNSWYRPHESIPGTNLSQLRCGAYSIGIARSRRTLKTYENWHKKLRANYVAPAKDIHAKSQELDEIAQDRRQRLQEFSDIERLPGHCELCQKLMV